MTSFCYECECSCCGCGTCGCCRNQKRICERIGHVDTEEREQYEKEENSK